MRLALAAVFLAFIGCVSSHSRPLTTTENRAVQSAEAFIARHGYTTTGHPSDLPVENVEVLDPLASREQLVQWRRATLEPRAFGIAYAAPGVYWVLFHRLGSENEFRAVRVQGVTPTQVVHSLLILDQLRWKSVPAH